MGTKIQVPESGVSLWELDVTSLHQNSAELEKNTMWPYTMDLWKWGSIPQMALHGEVCAIP